jgi:hexulose-6-phosphate isomerase
VPADRLVDNPIRSSAGRDRIRQLVTETGVRILSVCADYFMEHPFFRVTPSEQLESVSVLMGLISEARAVGATTVLVPVLEEAAITTDHERNELIECLREPLSLARSINVTLGLETELPSATYLELVEKIDHDYARVYYDTGNAAAKGYDIAADVRRLGRYLCGVHVKDRQRNGPSVPLGRGVADFRAFFEALGEVRYRGPIVLQTAFDDDYLQDAKTNLDFVRRHLGRDINQ